MSDRLTLARAGDGRQIRLASGIMPMPSRVSYATASTPMFPPDSPTMPASAAPTRNSMWSGALVFGCLFVGTLPFHHLLAVRSSALGLAALLTFIAGGWREMPKLPLIAGWAAWMVLAGVSVAFAHDRFLSLTEYRYEEPVSDNLNALHHSISTATTRPS